MEKYDLAKVLYKHARLKKSAIPTVFEESVDINAVTDANNVPLNACSSEIAMAHSSSSDMSTPGKRMKFSNEMDNKTKPPIAMVAPEMKNNMVDNSITKTCAVLGCEDYKYLNEESFFRFPEDPTLRQLWTHLTGRLNWTPTDYSYICVEHFSIDSIDVSVDSISLQNKALPSLKLPGQMLELEYIDEETLENDILDMDSDRTECEDDDIDTIPLERSTSQINGSMEVESADTKELNKHVEEDSLQANERSANFKIQDKRNNINRNIKNSRTKKLNKTEKEQEDMKLTKVDPKVAKRKKISKDELFSESDNENNKSIKLKSILQSSVASLDNDDKNVTKSSEPVLRKLPTREAKNKRSEYLRQNKSNVMQPKNLKEKGEKSTAVSKKIKLTKSNKRSKLENVTNFGKPPQVHSSSKSKKSKEEKETKSSANTVVDNNSSANDSLALVKLFSEVQKMQKQSIMLKNKLKHNTKVFNRQSKLLRRLNEIIEIKTKALEMKKRRKARVLLTIEEKIKGDSSLVMAMPTKQTDDLKNFCLNIYKYSPQAYIYLRNTLRTMLPSTEILESWISSGFKSKNVLHSNKTIKITSEQTEKDLSCKISIV